MKHLVLIPIRSPLDAIPVAEMTLPLYVSSDELQQDLNQRSELFPLQLEWYSDDGLIRTDQDELGHKLRFVTAKVAAEIVGSQPAVKPCEWDSAIVSLLQNLPEKTRVIIWWHGSQEVSDKA